MRRGSWSPNRAGIREFARAGISRVPLRMWVTELEEHQLALILSVRDLTSDTIQASSSDDVSLKGQSVSNRVFDVRVGHIEMT